MTDLQGIIFDKDGTLFEFAATWEAWAQAFLLRMSAGDRARATKAGHAIGFDLERRRFAPDSIVIAGTSSEIAEIVAEAFPETPREEVLKILDDEASMAPQVEAVPLVPYFNELRSMGLKVGVATNDSEAPARAHLQSANVLDLLDFVAGSDSGHGGKPAPGQLLAFCAATGCDPSRVAMVGDSTHDLHAGQAAGMTCLGVLTGMADRSVLEPLAEVVFPDIGHIPGWLVQQR